MKLRNLALSVTVACAGTIRDAGDAFGVGSDE